MAKLCRLILVLAVLSVAVAVVIVGAQYFYLCLLFLLVYLWLGVRRWKGDPTAFGSARLAGVFDLVRHVMLGGDDGMILGRASLCEPSTLTQAVRGLLSPAVDSATACRVFLASLRGGCDRRLIRIRKYVHLLTVAPAGAGKSIAVLVINLLSFRGSSVVVDPKGELFKLTSLVRKVIFGHKIIRLDPNGLVGPAESTDGLNPLDFIDENAIDFIDECRALADMLVLEKGTEHEPHWNARAVDILTGFIAFVCALERDLAKRNLKLVLSLVSSPVSFKEVIRTMQSIPAFHGVLRQMGDEMTWIKGRELGGVVSTMSRHIGFLKSPMVTACLSKSTFDPHWLRSDKLTVYLVLPSEKLRVLSPLMRVWLGVMLRQLTRHGASEKHPVTFFVDEAAHIGKLQPLEDAVTLMRGYGVRLWLFFQSLDQLKKTYGESASIILDNMGTQQYFGINSLETAEHLSKRMGDRTQLIESINRSVSRSQPTGGRGEGGSVSTSESINISMQGRRLIKEEEVLLLPENVALVFHRNLPPIAASLVKYFEAPEFAKGAIEASRRLGPGALVLSVITLLASLMIVAMAISVPSPAELQRSMNRPIPRLSTPLSRGVARTEKPLRVGQKPPLVLAWDGGSWQPQQGYPVLEPDEELVPAWSYNPVIDAQLRRSNAYFRMPKTLSRRPGYGFPQQASPNRPYGQTGSGRSRSERPVSGFYRIP